MKVQRNWLKVTVVILLFCSIQTQVKAQISEDAAIALLSATTGGVILPSMFILLEAPGVYGFISVSAGLSSFYYGLVNEEEFGYYMGTAFLLGGAYLMKTVDGKKSTQLLGHYGIWLAVSGVFAHYDYFSYANVSPIITPTGAGIRYRF